MMANLRKYAPKTQLSKVVTVKELEEAKEKPEGVADFQHECGQCKALQELPIDAMCSFCSTQLCQTCRPKEGENKCPVCDGCFCASGLEAPSAGPIPLA